MGLLFRPKLMSKKLDDPSEAMAYLALLSGIVALGFFGELARLSAALWFVYSTRQDISSLVFLAVLFLLYVWILNFLVVLGIASFQKWRRSKR